MEKKGLKIVLPLSMAALLLLLAVSAKGGSIVRSRHDLSSLNWRGYQTETGPMQGGTFSDYREACVYCHTPHNSSSAAPLWNRELPKEREYRMYSSPNFDSKTAKAPDGISLACLSCHDGTVAVDSVLKPPKFHAIVDAGVKHRMTLEGEPGTDSCSKCHNRSEGAYGGVSGAHDATIRYFTKDLRDDHAFSMVYPSLDIDPQFNQPMILKADGGRMFANGVQTFEGDKVQCASCHDIHSPDEKNLEGRDPFLRTSNRGSALCLTCHQK
ncbi:MAG: cytochrome c3 family protein [Nitrospirota bacterium]|nr:cytochrome c3 family protein [Nitrospirota bacterium]